MSALPWYVVDQMAVALLMRGERLSGLEQYTRRRSHYHRAIHAPRFSYIRPALLGFSCSVRSRAASIRSRRPLLPRRNIWRLTDPCRSHIPRRSQLVPEAWVTFPSPSQSARVPSRPGKQVIGRVPWRRSGAGLGDIVIITIRQSGLVVGC
jgi:hypothetical protein